jgi:hypothetical protein
MKNKFDRREVLKVMGGAFATLPLNKLASSINLLQGGTAPRNAPNFIFILTDDQQQQAMSA